MVRNTDIKVSYLTRVEGHGNITAQITDGRLSSVHFEIIEAPRVFESFLRGHGYEDVAHMASRICGICAVSHKCAALKAAESAFDATLSAQSTLLRRLAFHGEVLSSHILHVYFLAGPDFLGLPSVFPLMETDPEVVYRAQSLKNLAYDLCAVTVGRHTHPVGMTPGGFTFVHSEEKLAELIPRLEQARNDLQTTINLVKEFSIPAFERETAYVSLTDPDHYAFYDGDIVSSNGDTVSVDGYRSVIEETVVAHSTAKHARWNGSRYMVGALARVNNNFEQLLPAARTAAEDLGLDVPSFNPFMNTHAQLVECVHCVEECLDILDELLARGIHADEELTPTQPLAGQGVGAVEAPRGLLLHDYSYDKHGKCTSANLVIPTAQNLATLEADMEEFIPTIIHRDKEHIRHQLEMLARAYDPCISCSTHVIYR